jgi:hypothetical protein
MVVKSAQINKGCYRARGRPTLTRIRSIYERLRCGADRYRICMSNEAFFSQIKKHPADLCPRVDRRCIYMSASALAICAICNVPLGTTRELFAMPVCALNYNTGCHRVNHAAAEQLLVEVKCEMNCVAWRSNQFIKLKGMFNTFQTF